jgi:uncharacterized membrane protein
MFSLPHVEYISFWGELAALSAACLWALGSVIYTHAGARIPALELNLIKTVVAIAFLIPTLLLQGITPPTASPLPLYLLLLSGVVGIGLADTFFLEALKQLGARRTLLIKTLDPPIAALLSTIFLQEKLSAIAWCGILLVILGVAWVVTERVPGAVQFSLNGRKKFNLNTSLGHHLRFTICRWTSNWRCFIPTSLCSNQYQSLVECIATVSRSIARHHFMDVGQALSGWTLA